MKAQVGGKIAQLGARLIDATAKQMADAFFDRFAAAVAPPRRGAAPRPPRVAAATAPAGPAISVLDMIPREPLGLPLVGWIGGVHLLVHPDPDVRKPL